MAEADAMSNPSAHVCNQTLSPRCEDFSPHCADGIEPCYPFPSDFCLDVDGSKILVCHHLCAGHPATTRAVALFFPGMHGGVGPCRTPPANFDEHALYPTLAARIAEKNDVDCYRCSWPYMRPTMEYAVKAALKVLRHAVKKTTGGRESDAGEDRIIDIILIGHSLGGLAVWRTAKIIALHIQAGTFKRLRRRFNLRLSGFCTLNGCVTQHTVEEDLDGVAPLCDARALFVVGLKDRVVPPMASMGAFTALPITQKRLLTLEDGEHDLFTCKDRLILELERFILGENPRDAEPGDEDVSR